MILSRKATAASDVWSFGCLMHEAWSQGAVRSTVAEVRELLGACRGELKSKANRSTAATLPKSAF